MKIAIRADGGINIGMGHIQRCLALAQQLKKKKGAGVIFIFQKNEIVKEKIEKEGFKGIELKKRISLKEDLGETSKIIEERNIDILITDSYKFNQDYLVEIKKKTPFLISIDDLGKFPFPSDIVINQNVYAQELNCRSLNGKTKFLLGPNYALLREEFINVKERGIKERVQNILITLGGADIFNLTPKLLKALDKTEKNFNITVIIGPFFKNLSEIKKMIKKMKKKVNLVINSSSISKLMLSSDLAISGGGITLYELAATGTPTLSFCLANNQLKSIEGMEKKSVTVNLGWGNKFDKEKFRQNFSALCNNFNLRRRMSQKGQKLVDGKGVQRVTNLIL